MADLVSTTRHAPNKYGGRRAHPVWITTVHKAN
jgi:hypothetical protein